MSHERDADDALKALGALMREEEDDMPSEDPLFAPLSEAEQRGIADAVLSRLAAEAPGEHEATVTRIAPRRPRARWLTATSALVAAAAALLFMLRPEAQPLPTYALIGPANEKLFRGEDEQPTREGHTIGATLEVVLRPATRTDAAVEVRAFVEAPGRLLAPFAPRVERVDGGALVLRADTGQGGELSLTPGRYRLIFLLGPAGLALDDPRDPPQGAQRLEHELLLRAP